MGADIEKNIDTIFAMSSLVLTKLVIHDFVRNESWHGIGTSFKQLVPGEPHLSKTVSELAQDRHSFNFQKQISSSGAGFDTALYSTSFANDGNALLTTIVQRSHKDVYTHVTSIVYSEPSGITNTVSGNIFDMKEVIADRLIMLSDMPTKCMELSDFIETCRECDWNKKKIYQDLCRLAVKGELTWDEIKEYLPVDLSHYYTTDIVLTELNF